MEGGEDEDAVENGLFIPIRSGLTTDDEEEEEEESRTDEVRIDAMDQYKYRY